MKIHIKLLAALTLPAALLVAPQGAWALPAFGTQFGEKCSTCHSPQPPRLNNVGLTFKRLGYRFLDVDDNDNLTYRTREEHGAGADLSGRAVLQAIDSSGKPWTLNTHEIEIMAAGSLGSDDTLSYFAEYVLQEEDEGSAMEEGRAQYAHGDPTGVFTVRAGQFSPMLWRKGNGGRLTTSRPSIIGDRVPKLTGADGTGAAVSRSMIRLRERQQGIELGYAVNRLNDGIMSNTFVTGTITKGLKNGRTTNGSDAENSKDITLQVMHLYGDRNTISALWWDGKDASGSVGTTKFTDESTRIGLFGNHVVAENTDLLYGYLTGTDNLSTAGAPDLDSDGYFLELDYTTREATEDTGPLTVVARYDRFSQDNYNFTTGTATTGQATKSYTLGLVGQQSQNLLWSVEYHKVQGGSRQITAEAQIVF